MKFVLKILVLVGLIVLGKYLKDENKSSTLATRMSAAEVEINTVQNSDILPASQSEDQHLNPFFNKIPLTTETSSTVFGLN